MASSACSDNQIHQLDNVILEVLRDTLVQYISFL